MPGVIFDPASKGAQAYIAFGGEMVERVKSM
jgi:chromosome partitioning protein